MKIWKCKGTSKTLWIIAIIFVIFLIGGIFFLIIPRTPTKIVKTRPPIKLSVINIKSISTSYDKNLGYCIDEIVLKVKNGGHPPAHISGANVEIDGIMGSSGFIPGGVATILPDKTATVTLPFKRFCHLKKGKYTASIKLMKGRLKGRETVATYKAKISIP